jgi:ribosomal protein S18 acetylase RimI-like enzyme
METKEIILENMPDIKGLRFRGFLGEADYPNMVAIVEAHSKADNDDFAVTLESLKHDYAHLTNSNPTEDMIFAEIDGKAVAYSRVQWWQEEEPNDRIYMHFVKIKPKWRFQGIEEAMIRWCEDRLKAIAEGHPKDSERILQTDSSEFKPDYNKLLESFGYKATRFFIEMSRPLDDIPEAVLPEEIEVRPVMKEDTRMVWDASVEAFRDHWGYSPPYEEDYIGYTGSKYFQPALWQVAWDRDKVVSGVLNYIDQDYNKKFDRKRGWTENIFTLRNYRRRGIAKALIVRSMHMHKAKGMTEVGLGVDTNNTSNALNLYQSLGYHKDKMQILYRKPMQN